MLRDPKLLFHPVVVVACAVLTASAVGLDRGLKALILEYSKEAIVLRKPLQDFDTSRVLSVRPDYETPFFDTSASEFVGTDDVLRVCFKDAENPDRRDLQVLLFVTYYSDPRDTIPHTPEVCYRQGGATVSRLWIEPIEVEVPGAEDGRITARAIDLELQGWDEVLLYTFCSNGKFYDDRLKVRWAMGMPGDRHVYFSKIEVVTSIAEGTTHADAVERCKRVLQEIIPVLVDDHYPTREDVSRRPDELAQRSGAPGAPG